MTSGFRGDPSYGFYARLSSMSWRCCILTIWSFGKAKAVHALDESGSSAESWCSLKPKPQALKPIYTYIYIYVYIYIYGGPLPEYMISASLFLPFVWGGQRLPSDAWG